MKVINNFFEKIVSLENLFSAWEKFRKGKLKKQDVREFSFQLEQNIFALHRELKNKTYQHGNYENFLIRDPKLRQIHKASVRDRVLHHAVFQKLDPIYEPTFIHHSFSCRRSKGNHKGVAAAERMIRKVSKNYTAPCFVLKCDIAKFFDSVNHEILIGIIKKKIANSDALWLMSEILHSYSSKRSDLFTRRGLPIGNLTSQIFANIYMNEFDQFVKHKLKVRHYARYTDDFLIISNNHAYLQGKLKSINAFLNKQLNLRLHPNKITISTPNQGVDFLGYVIFPHYRLLRTKTRRRVFQKMRRRVREFKRGETDIDSLERSLQSYLGVLSHANTHELAKKLKNKFWFWLTE